MSLARITLDLSALRHNLAIAREAAPGRRVLAVIKANAYGHGMLECARALADADGFAVARLEEARLLRQHYPQHFILIMGLEASAEAWADCARQRLAVVIHSSRDAHLLADLSLPAPLPVWLKIDTGMHRLGIAPAQCATVFARLQAAASVASVTLMTHLACADETGHPMTARQLAAFHEARGGLAAETSIANSAALLTCPDSHGDWVRPGIMLYGYDPLDTPTPLSTRLRPAMCLESVLLAVRDIAAGESVGYGACWQATGPARIGTVAIGYGDGYPRSAAAGTPVWVAGRTVPLVGRVSMDLLTVDLSAHPGAAPGDAVELWGQHVPINTVARYSQTISYELTTRLTARPLRRIRD